MSRPDRDSPLTPDLVTAVNRTLAEARARDRRKRRRGAPPRATERFNRRLIYQRDGALGRASDQTGPTGPGETAA